LAVGNRTGGVARNAPLVYTAGIGNLSITANAGASAGAITDNGSGLVTATNLSLAANSGIGTLVSPVLLAPGTIVSASNSGPSASGDLSILVPSAGNLTLAGVQNTVPGGLVQVATSGGAINTGTVLVSSQGAVQITANAGGIAAGNTATLTVGSGGISTAGGKVVLRSADDMALNGPINSNNGDVILVAGNTAGMATVYGIASAATMPDGSNVAPAAESIADSNGAIAVNGQVNAGTGNITLTASGTVTQTLGAGGGGLHNSAAGAGTGDLVVRTYNDTPGGGIIDLENDANPQGNLNGSVTLEAHFAADTTLPSLTPVGGYAPSNIGYKSYSGLVIRGVGTAADYTGVATTQNIDLAALNIQARNLTLIASSGNVDVNTQITNANINSGLAGGSLNLLASGDININPVAGTNGVTIGQGTATDSGGNRTVVNFNHDLKLAAQGNINIHGSMYITGDLALRADASAAETAALTFANPASIGMGDGLGGVRVSTPVGATQPVEVKANNIIVGAVNTTTGTQYPVQFLTIDANAAGVTATASGIQTVVTNASLTAAGSINIYLGSGDLNMLGGTAQATATVGGVGGDVAKAFSVASMQAANIAILGVGGASNHSNMLLQAGTADATVTAGGALASADALIVATNSKTVTIGGDLVLNGGTTTHTGSGVVSATASIDPSQLNITTGGNVVLQAGTGTNADAHITNEGGIVMNINGSGSYTYSNLGLGTTLTLGPGLIVIGSAPGSGLFDGTNGKLDGHDLPIHLKFGGGGSYQLAADSGRGIAFVQTGVLPGFDTNLINYIIFAANEETRTSRVRAGLGSGDDSSAPSCN